jgi:hypothetical protein
MLESLCRGLWSTNIPKQHHAILASNVVSLDNITDKPESYIEPRDLMSMPKCQIFKAQDCMPETLWYESTKGKARCQTLFYWLIKLFSMQHQDATLSNTASETHTISTSTANLVSQGLASTSDREGESTTPSSTQPLFRSLVSMFNLETPHKLLNAPKNKYSVSFISNLNPNIMQHLNLAQQIVHTMANANTREANNAAAAYSSQHLCIFQSNVNYLAAMSTANAHLIRAHRFVVDENHAASNERFSSCYDECICAGSRHMIQDQQNALSGHFVPILSAWLFLYLAHNINSGEDKTKGSQHVTSRLTSRRRTSSIIINGSRIFTREESRLSHQRSFSSCDDKSSLGYFSSSISSALASEGVRSELTKANLTRTTSFQAKLHTTNWIYILWNKQLYQNSPNYDLKVL